MVKALCIYAWAFFALTVFSLQGARGGTIGFDAFAYAADSLAGKNGGTGWSAAWGTGQIIIAASGLAHPSGGLPVSGGATQLNLGSIFGTTTSTRTLTTSMGTAGTTAWYSFLLKPDRTGAFDYDGLNLGAGGTQFFVGYQGTNFVLNKAGGGGTNVSISFASVGFSVGQTAFVVLKVVFTAGIDSATIYINPTTGLSAPDSPPSNKGTKIDLDVITFSNIMIGGGRGFNANNAMLDEIRVDTTYAGVAPPGPLPIQLSSLTARSAPGTQQVILRWTTLSETDNYGFEVQRRRESERDFATLSQSFIPGHGSTLDICHYSYTDYAVPQGMSYYRLRQMDLDGTVNYSFPVSVDVGETNGGSLVPFEYALCQNFPNPFNPTTTIRYTIARSGHVRLDILNVLGQTVRGLVGQTQEAGSYNVTFDATDLPSGIYLFRLRAGEMVQTRKMVLLN